MYFLPASLQWTTELLKYQPAWNGQIDPNSQAWRIVYEVTAYRYVDANGNIVIYPPAMAPATPSTAPQVDTTGGYVTGAYDNDGFTQWMQGDMVQYAVTFVNAAGESNFSAWSSWVQVGASICAGVNIPTDPSGAATSRNLYRKFQSSQTPERVLTILDNTTTHVFDTVAAVNFDPPAQAPEYPLDPSQFAARSNFPYSTVWVPGNQVQYAVSFVYETGETALGPYSGWSTVGPFAFPLLSGVPCSKDIRTAGKNYPGCIARKIYRSAQAPGAGGTMVPIETGVLVATISNNTDTTAQDPPALWSSSVSTVALAQTARG